MAIETSSVFRRGLDKEITGIDAAAYGKLASLGAVALEFSQNPVDAWVHDHTAVHRDHLAAFPVDETERAVFADGKTGVVPVPVPVLRRQSVTVTGGQSNPPTRSQGIDNYVPFDLQLGLVANVLPLTPGTVAKVGAGCGDAERRGLQHFHHPCCHVTSAFPEYLGHNLFTGDAAKYKDPMSIDNSRSFAKPAPGLRTQT